MSDALPYRAFISRSNFGLDQVRLYVARFRGYQLPYDTLLSDGTWGQGVDGATLDTEGLRLPSEAIEAIARAIEEFQGHASHADTEARVLRESLEVERARVDRVLAAMSLYERIAETQR